MEPIIEAIGARGELSGIVLVGTLVVFRLLPMIFLTPFLGGKLVPAETKMGLSVGLAVVVFPHATAAMSGPMPDGPLAYLALMFKEIFLGFVIGFIAAKIFYAMEIGGRILDVMRGSNMAEVQVPELSLRASPLGDLLLQLLLIVFLGVGGHRYFLEAVMDSFRVVPLDRFPTLSGGFETWVEEILRYSQELFAIAFAIVFPGLFVTFMTDIVFGMLNRVAPQLNAYFMAMGVKALGAIALLFFGLGMAADVMVDISIRSTEFLRQVVRNLG